MSIEWSRCCSVGDSLQSKIATLLSNWVEDYKNTIKISWANKLEGLKNSINSKLKDLRGNFDGIDFSPSIFIPENSNLTNYFDVYVVLNSKNPAKFDNEKSYIVSQRIQKIIDQKKINAMICGFREGINSQSPIDDGFRIRLANRESYATRANLRKNGSNSSAYTVDIYPVLIYDTGVYHMLSESTGLVDIPDKYYEINYEDYFEGYVDYFSLFLKVCYDDYFSGSYEKYNLFSMSTFRKAVAISLANNIYDCIEKSCQIIMDQMNGNVQGFNGSTLDDEIHDFVIKFTPDDIIEIKKFFFHWMHITKRSQGGIDTKTIDHRPHHVLLQIEYLRTKYSWKENMWRSVEKVIGAPYGALITPVIEVSKKETKSEVQTFEKVEKEEKIEKETFEKEQPLKKKKILTFDGLTPQEHAMNVNNKNKSEEDIALFIKSKDEILGAAREGFFEVRCSRLNASIRFELDKIFLDIKFDDIRIQSSKYPTYNYTKASWPEKTKDDREKVFGKTNLSFLSTTSRTKKIEEEVNQMLDNIKKEMNEGNFSYEWTDPYFPESVERMSEYENITINQKDKKIIFSWKN